MPRMLTEQTVCCCCAAGSKVAKTGGATLSPGARAHGLLVERIIAATYWRDAFRVLQYDAVRTIVGYAGSL